MVTDDPKFTFPFTSSKIMIFETIHIHMYVLHL